MKKAVSCPGPTGKNLLIKEECEAFCNRQTEKTAANSMEACRRPFQEDEKKISRRPKLT